jgi:hypothetical protein
LPYEARDCKNRSRLGRLVIVAVAGLLAAALAYAVIQLRRPAGAGR